MDRRLSKRCICAACGFAVFGAGLIVSSDEVCPRNAVCNLAAVEPVHGPHNERPGLPAGRTLMMATSTATVASTIGTIYRV